MNQSTNYNFNLPEGTDLVNLLTQLIPNWSNLDTILKGVQDATFSSATEIVSLNVHAITRSNPDSKLLRWIATANFEAGDTFTIDGISTPAALPSGEALGEDAYIAGSTVIAALNSDESLLTVFVTSGAIALAADSERLGGELPSYYATKSYADGIKTTADNASSAISLKSLVNTYYDNVGKKLYMVNPDGTQGGEIVLNRELDLANAVDVISAGVVTAHTTTKSGVLLGNINCATSVYVLLDSKRVAKSGANEPCPSLYIPDIPAATNITIDGTPNNVSYVTFVPYK